MYELVAGQLRSGELPSASGAELPWAKVRRSKQEGKLYQASLPIQPVEGLPSGATYVWYRFFQGAKGRPCLVSRRGICGYATAAATTVYGLNHHEDPAAVDGIMPLIRRQITCIEGRGKYWNWAQKSIIRSHEQCQTSRIPDSARTGVPGGRVLTAKQPQGGVVTERFRSAAMCQLPNAMPVVPGFCSCGVPQQPHVQPLPAEPESICQVGIYY